MIAGGRLENGGRAGSATLASVDPRPSEAPTITGPSPLLSMPASSGSIPVSAEGVRLKLSFLRDEKVSLEERAAAHLRFRRAFTVGYPMWAAFTGVDWMVVRYLGAPSFLHLVLLRIAVVVVVFPVLIRLYRGAPLRRRALTVLDVYCYTTSSVAMAIMCAEFGGLASPYAAGLCLVLLARIVTAQDPWPRGLLMSGTPVLAFYLVLFGSALFLPGVAAQFSDASALTMLLLHSAYIIGTYVFLVVGGHVVWSLRRQVFEARNLGRYRLKRRLAAGGMGEVWVAYHPSLKRDVAVKILRNEVQMQSENAVPRFEREARATADLQHPNTVRVFDYGATEDGLLYYVMELLEGETIAEHVERVGPVSPARAVHIIDQAARAISEAHERGIVHRDIKPENLFLTSLGGEQDFVKVLDFGIAKIAEAEDGNITRTGWMLGTPLYMSPEVVSGGAADAQSDVYALGAVLYFMLCGKPPFDSPNPGALVFAQVHRAATPPSERLGRPLPVDLEALIMRSLQKDPADRYVSATEFVRALASCTHLEQEPDATDDTVRSAKRSSSPLSSPARDAVPRMRVPLTTGQRAVALASRTPSSPPSPLTPGS
jgi:serine/threonine-protein kinase